MKKNVLFVILCLIPTIMSYSQWKRITDIPAYGISNLDLVNNVLYVGFDTVLYRSSDAGLTWNITNPISNSPKLIQVVAGFAGKLFVGTSGTGVFTSADDGITWQQINTGLNDPGAANISSFVEWKGKLLAATYGAGTFILNPDMQSWTSFGNLPLIAGTVYAITTIGDTLIAGAGASGYIYRLTPGSSQWDPISFSGGSTIPAVSFVQLNGILYAGSIFGVWRSSDNGLTWENASNGLYPDGEYFITAFKNTLYAAARIKYATYLYKSTDRGDNWIFDDPVIPNYAYDMEISGNKIFLTSVDGLLYRDIQVTNTNDNNSVPKSFSLSQNYPNPFNPVTIISYALPKASHVTIKVYDILGREVTTLVNEEKNAGNYNAQFSAGKLASGIYLYKMQAGNFQETKKLLIMK